MFRDFLNNTEKDQVVDPAVVTTDANGSSVNLAGYDSVTFLALVGETTTTLNSTNNIELEIEESANDSDFTDVADADLEGYVAGTNDGCFGVIDAAADDDTLYSCQYHGNKQYARPVINVVGTVATGPPIGIVALRHGYKYQPVD
jgi:hypothetical protein